MGVVLDPLLFLQCIVMYAKITLASICFPEKRRGGGGGGGDGREGKVTKQSLTVAENKRGEGGTSSQDYH